ncbi:MAG: methyltransferase domain-containing protein, partial [Candidatus Aenigmarchaeota archaeon]|nr:methyltransferase domain-containing protein [Candidatus Aenigmarchaeota archaeon]
MKLDIGCGDKKNENSIGIDVERTPDTDVLASADSFLPFKDGAFDEIFCYHILEHSEDLLFTMNEIWRISKNNARIHIRVPYFESVYAFSD